MQRWSAQLQFKPGRRGLSVTQLSRGSACHQAMPGGAVEVDGDRLEIDRRHPRAPPPLQSRHFRDNASSVPPIAKRPAPIRPRERRRDLPPAPRGRRWVRNPSTGRFRGACREQPWHLPADQTGEPPATTTPPRPPRAVQPHWFRSEPSTLLPPPPRRSCVPARLSPRCCWRSWIRGNLLQADPDRANRPI